MSLNALRKGTPVLIESARFVILKKLDRERWQLENTATGEWRVFTEHNLLDLFADNKLLFLNNKVRDGNTLGDRALASYSPEMIALAETRVQYLERNRPASTHRVNWQRSGISDQRCRRADRRCAPAELAHALPRLSQMAGGGPRDLRHRSPACRPWRMWLANAAGSQGHRRYGHRRTVHDAGAKAGSRLGATPNESSAPGELQGGDYKSMSFRTPDTR